MSIRRKYDFIRIFQVEISNTLALDEGGYYVISNTLVLDGVLDCLILIIIFRIKYVENV